MPRLFTAIEIPDPVRDRLSFLRGGLPGARWIDVENYHITLRFIGDVDDTVADDVADILMRVRRPAMALELDGLGTFGGNKPHSLYARVRPNAELTALQAEHERLMQRIGLRPEQRNFTPHVTLARLRGVAARGAATYLGLRGGFFAPAFTADRFVLFSSKAREGGGPYLVEETYPLTPVAGTAEMPVDEFELDGSELEAIGWQRN